MTATIPAGVAFPGDELAKPVGDGWERRNGSDLAALPFVPTDDAVPCPSNGGAGSIATAGFRKDWRCTAHVHGWHRARLSSGHVIAVWPDKAVQ